MLGDLRVLATARRRRAAARHASASALQALFDMIRRFKVGCDVELHKRTLERGLLSLIGPRRRRASPARRSSPAGRARARGAASSAASPRVASRTDLGVDLLCAAADTDAAARGAARRRRRGRAARQRPRSLRVETGRPRYGVDLDDSVDPAGGRPQRARGELHEGLLRRPGDGRAPALQGQAEPPPARAAAVGAAAEPASRAARSASARSGALGSVAARRASGPIALALVRREAEPGRRARGRRGRRRRARGRRAAVRLSAAAPFVGYGSNAGAIRAHSSDARQPTDAESARRLLPALAALLCLAPAAIAVSGCGKRQRRPRRRGRRGHARGRRSEGPDADRVRGRRHAKGPQHDRRRRRRHASRRDADDDRRRRPRRRARQLRKVDPADLKTEMRLVDKILYMRSGLLSKPAPEGQELDQGRRPQDRPEPRRRRQPAQPVQRPDEDARLPALERRRRRGRQRERSAASTPSTTARTSTSPRRSSSPGAPAAPRARASTSS